MLRTHTHGRTDNMKTVYPPTNTVWGGGGGGGGGGRGRDTHTRKDGQHENSIPTHKHSLGGGGGGGGGIIITLYQTYKKISILQNSQDPYLS